jgi:hypothetical protein
MQQPGLPLHINMDYDGINLVITRKWWGKTYKGLLFFTLIWNSFLVFWYFMAFKTGSTMMKIFPVFHVAIGLFLAYKTLTGIFNKTYIRVNTESIQVEHKPIPYVGNKTLLSKDVKQLYSKKRVTRTSNGAATVSYEVRAILTNGKETKLVTELETPDQAKFIEMEIERYLGIRDMPVRGELRSS